MAEKSVAPGDASMVFATVHDYEGAKKVTFDLKEKKLVVGATITPGIWSMFEDEGEREESHSELLLVMKTMTCKMDELTAYLRESHPGEPDDVVSIKIDNGSLPYLQWISANVNPGGQD